MKLSSFKYIWKEPFISIGRNGAVSAAAISTVVIALFLCGIFWMLLYNVNEQAKKLEESVEVMAYLQDGLDEATQAELQARIEELPEVSTVTFISAEEGLQTLYADTGQAEDVLLALDGENPLPDSFCIKTSQPEDVITVAEELEGWENIERVRYGEGTVEHLFLLLKWLRVIGLVIMLLLALSAVVLISMTIRLSVESRRREVRVMKYVGATNWFIRWPYVLEGMLIGFIGALLALVALILCYQAGLNYLGTVVSFVDFVPLSQLILPMVGVLLASGVVVGGLGSIIAMAKSRRV